MTHKNKTVLATVDMDKHDAGMVGIRLRAALEREPIQSRSYAASSRTMVLGLLAMTNAELMELGVGVDVAAAIDAFGDR